MTLPEWSPPEGPWCLKRWLDFRQQLVTLCVREVGHDGDCRDQDGFYFNNANSKFLGHTDLIP